MRSSLYIILGLATLIVGVGAVIGSSMIAITGDTNEVDPFHVIVGSTAIGLNAIIAMGGAGFFLRRAMIRSSQVVRTDPREQPVIFATGSLIAFGISAMNFNRMLSSEGTGLEAEGTILGVGAIILAAILALIAGIIAADRHK